MDGSNYISDISAYASDLGPAYHFCHFPLWNDVYYYYTNR